MASDIVTVTQAAATAVSPAKNGKHDVITHRLVVAALGATVIAVTISITVLEALGREPSPALGNIGSTAIGALAMTMAAIMRPH